MILEKLAGLICWQRAGDVSRRAEHSKIEGAKIAKSPTLIVVNGKFLGTGSTGVQRVAAELIRGLQRRIASDPTISNYLAIELWIPANARAGAAAAALPARVVGPFSGIPWEQVTLPLRAKGAIVLSLCNVGPMLRDRLRMG